MQPSRRPFRPTSPTMRVVVLWLIALALPFDGAAVGAQAVRGPLHLHRAVAASAQRLVDFRRDSVAPALQPPAVLADAHTHAGAQRHRHAFADTSVVVLGDDAADADHGAATVLAALVALPTASCDWRATALPGAAAWCAAWAPSSGRRKRLERPPRLG